MAREGNGVELIQQDLAISIFLKGLRNQKIQETLASKKYATLKKAYEEACIYEEVYKEVGMKGAITEDPVERKQLKKKPKHSKERPHRSTSGFNYKTNPSFAGTGEQKRVSTGPKQVKDKSKVKCYKCQKFGHYANECPRRGNLARGRVAIEED